MSHQPPVRTALFEEHNALDANMVDFHGFELPIWYSNIRDEHLATRTSAGLFDVSHMGSFRFVGESVREWLEGIGHTAGFSDWAEPMCLHTFLG